MMGGKNTMMTDEEIEEAKNVEGIFDELYFTDDQIELVNISAIDGEDVYKVKVFKNEKTSYRYYSIKSGYLISVDTEDANKNIVSVKYGDYKNIEGYWAPHQMQINQGGQVIEFTTTEVLINTPLKDSDFY